eukprot:gnl/MRDRNA2_/MRDRNA2_92603_c0_seq1.p1 gnl/MRDRNA2_/MRDRNA2_92603_c0~~gnl/MRDRNA2_/MRDRNA2_92603_c0_seq1.p1  ORF type:complete len:559 (+),score=126.70 gnl/MRDRNA2_/MRDRNA2_92603_c0_seq1:61-1737(+)
MGFLERAMRCSLVFATTTFLRIARVGGEYQCHADSETCAAAARQSGIPEADNSALEEVPASEQIPHTVVDTQLYDILGVEPTATLTEIRKAFRKQSLKLHPDKNPDDPNAEETYRTILEAYEILSNPERRKLYDAEGLNAERVAEWMNILRKSGPAHALAQLHRAWNHLVHARWRPPCLSEAIYGFSQHEQCKDLEEMPEEKVKDKGTFYGLNGVLGPLGKAGGANASGRIAARWECEDENINSKFQRTNENMAEKGVEKTDGHRLSHWSVMEALRQAVQNLTGLEKDRWTTATTRSVSYGLHLVGLGCVRCAGPLPLNFLEVGSGMGVSMALVLLSMDMAGGQVSKVVSVDDYSGYPDDEREACQALHQTLNHAWSNEILTPEDRIPEGCGKAFKNAARMLWHSMKMPVETVNAPNLEALGWEELQKRRWLRTFSAVVVRLGGNRTMEHVLGDIMLASELLRHQGILILEDWFDDIFDVNVPGLYTDKGIPVTLGGCLDNTFVPWFVNWKMKFYIFQRRPEAELEGNPFLDGGEQPDDLGVPLRPDGATGEMGWRMA